MIGVEVKDGRYIVTLPKATLVLSREAFMQALRRGTWWRRRQVRQARQLREPLREWVPS